MKANINRPSLTCFSHRIELCSSQSASLLAWQGCLDIFDFIMSNCDDATSKVCTRFLHCLLSIWKNQ